MFGFLKGIFTRRRQIAPGVTGRELERLTDDLFQETKAMLDADFDSWIASFIAEDTPLSPREARNFIALCLQKAVDKRKLLTERIEASVESGEIYWNYYSKIQDLSEAMQTARQKQLQLQTDRENYQHYAQVLKRVREKSIIKELQAEDPEDTAPVIEDADDFFPGLTEIGGV